MAVVDTLPREAGSAACVDPSGPDRPRRRLRPRLFAVAAGLASLAVVATACSSTPPAVESNNLVASGLGAQSLGQTSQAIQYFKQAIAKDPNNKVAHYDLGVMYQQGGDSTGAINEYKKALVIDGKYRPALWNLAILQTISDPSESIRIYNELLNINPNDANVNFNLGLLLIDQGQSAEGHVLLDRAVQLNPSLKSRIPTNVSFP